MSSQYSGYTDNVFINCPFDDQYKPLLNAIIFTIFDCGFVARSALEVEDGAEVRMDKIYRLIDDCKFGIHDLSRTELDETNQLPRFNMPLELGCFLGAKRFGENKHKSKKALILDVERYRYQAFISDIAGQDIRAHNNDVNEVIRVVRNFLQRDSRRVTVPGANIIIEHYQRFIQTLPQMANDLRMDEEELGFNDICILSSVWLTEAGEIE
ncbi:hypothetical protein KFE96_06870 [Kordiimonas sp. SCSIO 12603]|uniref:hypothetical protein n=1 Tax=Kordiimonas sp. SCSIO 12603 TaxID=2829596 RepID=UPI002105E58C|nr:hypothetical protein [Kordiimonas sp. SCSIO 12603]UTW60024.1 hypothetical protein KFE96_06870 [Kordiimonas sp. SCSIO 12603]